MLMPKVSIVTASYNKPHQVGDTIKSVLAQTFTNFEYIIVENSTILDTKKVIRQFPDRRIWYIDEEFTETVRKKYYITSLILNKYYPQAHGAYILFLADDDLLFPDCLKYMVEYLDDNPDKNICYHDQVVMYDQKGKLSFEPLARGYGNILRPGEINPLHLLDAGQIMFRKKILKDIKQPYFPLEWQTAEISDKIFMEKLWQAGHSFYPLKKIGSCKRVFDTSVHPQRHPLRYFIYQNFTRYAPEFLQKLILYHITQKRRPLTGEEKQWFAQFKAQWRNRKS